MTEPETTGVLPALQAEWSARTWYGKLWFPVWIVAKAAVLLSILFMLEFGNYLVGEPSLIGSFLA